MTALPFQARLLDPGDYAEARALGARAGAHGVYVANFLRQSRPDGSELIGLHAEDRLAGLCLFGSRGNLVVLADPELDPERVASAILDQPAAWRIVLGPPTVVAALRARLRAPPLVDREQVYFGMRPQDAPSDRCRDDVRAADARDRNRLVAACLALNEADLGVDPRRVHRAWLRDTIERRIQDDSTRVIGPPGELRCKLDLGSVGPSGWMLEGVFTFPDHRGRGLATGLVATVAASAPAPLICLHVDAANAPAIAAYRRAGMRRLGECRLLLQRG